MIIGLCWRLSGWFSLMGLCLKIIAGQAWLGCQETFVLMKKACLSLNKKDGLLSDVTSGKISQPVIRIRTQSKIDFVFSI